MNRPSLAALTLAVVTACSGVALAQKADNSANNERNQPGRQATADEQSNSKSDVDLTQRIRRSVMEDKGLSTYGKNVKIVSTGGKVTLNGVVRTADEKSQIGQKAAAVAGANNVTNELKVAPAN